MSALDLKEPRSVIVCSIWTGLFARHPPLVLFGAHPLTVRLPRAFSLSPSSSYLSPISLRIAFRILSPLSSTNLCILLFDVPQPPSCSPTRHRAPTTPRHPSSPASPRLRHPASPHSWTALDQSRKPAEPSKRIILVALRSTRSRVSWGGSCWTPRNKANWSC